MSTDIRQHKAIEATLSKLGLTDKETFVYLDLLQNGPRPAAILAKRSGVTRTNGYDIIKNLEHKGLCFSTGENYGKKFHAHPPGALRELLSEKKKSLETLENELESIERFIKVNKVNPFFEHEVTYLEGADNIKKIFALMTAPHVSHIYGVGSELELEPYVGRETLLRFNEQRKKHKIFFSILRAGPDRLPGEAFHNDEAYFREVRIRPKGKVRLKSQVYLFDDTIIFLNLFDKPFATIIRNQPMFTMFHSWFDFIWNASKKTVSRKSK